MTNILFVCHGNICRSPMKDMVKKEGLEKEFLIESAATSTEELGNGVYPPVFKLLKEYGIDPSGKRARQIRYEDYDKYDIIIGMDSANIYNLNRFFDDKDNEIHLLLEYAGISRDISDPWYTRDFNATWDDVNLGCKHLLDSLKN